MSDVVVTNDIVYECLIKC